MESQDVCAEDSLEIFKSREANPQALVFVLLFSLHMKKKKKKIQLPVLKQEWIAHENLISGFYLKI